MNKLIKCKDCKKEMRKLPMIGFGGLFDWRTYYKFYCDKCNRGIEIGRIDWNE